MLAVDALRLPASATVWTPTETEANNVDGSRVASGSGAQHVAVLSTRREVLDRLEERSDR